MTFYFKVLFRAEHYAEQAVCGKCKVYGLIEVIAAPARDSQGIADAPTDDWLKVRCKKCAHNWTMSAEHAPPPIGKSL